MSWSINFIGTSENVIKALEENSEKLNGVSKEEYEEVLPHLVGLVKQNYNTPSPYPIKIDASGHGFKDANNDYKNCTVSIMSLGGTLV